LRAATENLYRPLDFLLAANNRVQLLLARQFGQISAKAVERRGLALGTFAPFAPFFLGASSAAAGTAAARFFALQTMAQQVEHLFADFLKLQAEVHQLLGGHALLLPEQAEQDVLGADVVVVEIPRLFHRVLDDLLGARRLRKLAHRDHVRSALDELLDLQSNLPQVDVEIFQ